MAKLLLLFVGTPKQIAAEKIMFFYITPGTPGHWMRRTKKLGCVCLRWNATDEEDHIAVAGEKVNNRTELNVGEWFGVTFQ